MQSPQSPERRTTGMIRPVGYRIRNSNPKKRPNAVEVLIAEAKYFLADTTVEVTNPSLSQEVGSTPDNPTTLDDEPTNVSVSQPTADGMNDPRAGVVPRISAENVIKPILISGNACHLIARPGATNYSMACSPSRRSLRIVKQGGSPNYSWMYPVGHRRIVLLSEVDKTEPRKKPDNALNHLTSPTLRRQGFATRDCSGGLEPGRESSEGSTSCDASE
ncbi:uncharacterized protein BO80DRAFT_434883 [Aspergillus ibericus CBS 121593]|uniref:Uncharacterized protein n=1 Tax=Aspergillus ibericus CBS 121593 TaxID=1448316 RepID=A0A395GYV0_9EURO|nr:hypothetical protein BO80DRAFT_434883 [Aspergillus ibericus CBS 121593]RAL00792.1 hypothetical protein BO80DRAFT_434883 [Aspergillus ibericus CBS 121593]